MKKDNRWTGGFMSFQIPLGDELRGRSGPRFERAVFQEEVGPEFYLLVLEDPSFASAYGELTEVRLNLRSGVYSTPFGIIAFILWQIAAGTPQEVWMEQFLNPFEFDTIHMLSSIGKQSRMKLMIVDNETGSSSQFVDFENTFDIDEFLANIVSAIENEEPVDFELARDFVMREVDLSKLPDVN